MDDVTGVVLAGGQSTRFGSENKALARLGGEPIIQRVVATLNAISGPPPIVAVHSPRQQASYEAVLPSPVRYVTDDPSREGPVAGLVAAVERVSVEWLFVTGCDMPCLRESAMRWQLTHCSAGIDAVCLEDPDGQVNPLHAAYRKRSLTAISNEIGRAAGLTTLLANLSRVDRISLAAVPPEIPMATSMTDVNTQAELQALVERTREQS